MLFSGWNPPCCLAATEEFVYNPLRMSGNRKCQQGCLLTSVPLPCWLRWSSFLHSDPLNKRKQTVHHASNSSSTQVHMRRCLCWHNKMDICRRVDAMVFAFSVSELLYALQWSKEVGYSPALVASYHSLLTDWGLPGSLHNLLPMEDVLETLYSR